MAEFIATLARRPGSGGRENRRLSRLTFVLTRSTSLFGEIIGLAVTMVVAALILQGHLAAAAVAFLAAMGALSIAVIIVLRKER